MGTLFDAKLIKNIMLIKDCYFLMGNNIIEMEMNEKMLYIDSVIANQFHKEYCSNFKIKINKLYKYNMLNEIVTNIIPKCEIEITGLVFYPILSGVYYIFTDKKNMDKLNTVTAPKIVSNDSYNMINEITDFLTSRIYSYENSNIKKVLYVEPTNITDVFYVYENNEKLGVAHIPNYKVSTYCRENIKEKTKCMCAFYKPFNKWIPLNTIV
jgi:hypothetical protein